MGRWSADSHGCSRYCLNNFTGVSVYGTGSLLTSYSAASDPGVFAARRQLATSSWY
jgi:hypothetical protein